MVQSKLKPLQGKAASPLYLHFTDFKRMPAFADDTFYVLFVEDNPNLFAILKDFVKDALAEHDLSKIVWYSAPNLESAISYIDEADKKTGSRGYKGFDLVLCDLLIPKSDNPDECDITYGFAVARKIAEKQWLAPVIGLSAYTDEENTRATKWLLSQEEFEKEGIPVFGDFLAKGTIALNPANRALFAAKLRRHVIPLFHYAKAAAGTEESLFHGDPTFFVGNEMLRILRQLVWLSRLEVDSWRTLPKILLLGPTGSGKTHLASTYHRFLQLQDRILNRAAETRPPNPIRVNCAGLISYDLSGQIEMYGARDNTQALGLRRGHDIVTQLGAFERASVYIDGQGTRWTAFAPPNLRPQYGAGGVVFFDEFANLHLTLQAGVLNAIEEGWIRRTLDNSTVNIGCHIVCATNADPSKTTRETSDIDFQDIDSPRMRQDLLDRIPYVINVPSLREREPAEILGLLERFARLSSGVSEVHITPSAEEILFAAIKSEKNIVTSIRHLQSIARLQPGENVISDSNLRWVIEKARILKAKSLFRGGELTIAEKAKEIGLKEWLCVDLPPYTGWGVEQLYNVHKDPERHQVPNFQEQQYQTAEGQEKEWRYWLLSAYFEREATALKLFQKDKRIFNARRNQARKNFGLKTDGRKDRKNAETFDRQILLSPELRLRDSKSGDKP